MEVEKDMTLWGNRLTLWIDKHFPSTAKWFKDKNCGCDKRAEVINRLHSWIRGY